MKYTKQFKLDCVRKAKAGEHIPDPGGCSHATFRHSIRRWVAIFDRLGEAGLEHSKPMLSYEDKAKCVQRVIDGESMCSVARSIGRHEAQVSAWYGVYLREGLEGLKSKPKGRPRKMKRETKDLESLPPEEQIRELKRRLEIAEIEVEYLKKLDALVRKRKARRRKRE